MRGGQLYVEPEHFFFGYLGAGLEWTLVGGFAFAASAYAIFRRQARFGWLATGFLLALFGAIAVFTGLPTLPVQEANVKTGYFLGEVNSALFDWAQKHGHFPANQTELDEALAHLDRHSPFGRKGAPLSYRWVYVGEASEPVLMEPPPEDPGGIYCAVNQELRRVWLTATVLERPVGGPVVWLKVFGKPIVESTYLVDQWYRKPQH
jgi:hypothetical protein